MPEIIMKNHSLIATEKRLVIIYSSKFEGSWPWANKFLRKLIQVLQNQLNCAILRFAYQRKATEKIYICEKEKDT